MKISKKLAGMTFHLKLKNLKYLSVPPMVQQLDVFER